MNSTVTAPAFLDKLRSATTQSHTALEALPVSVSIMNPHVTNADYGTYLNLMHDVVKDAEENIFPVVYSILPDIDVHPKAQFIAADLQTLGFKKSTSGNTNLEVGYKLLQNNIPLAFGNTAKDNFFFGNAGNSTATGNYNTGLGSFAVDSLTTGSSNIGFGYAALFKNKTASNNVAIGHTSLFSNQTGSSNVAIGYESLYSLLINTGNTAIGYRSLKANTAANNTAFGFQSMMGNTTGTSNVGIGQALAANVTGSYNVGIGDFALNASTAGSNTAVGYGAAVATSTGTNIAAFGFSAGRYLTTESNIIVLNSIDRTTKAKDTTESVFISTQNATAANQRTKIGGLGNVGIGIYPTEKFTVDGNLLLAIAGNKIKIATGTNASVGTATLVGGTVTVSTTAALTASKIFVTVVTPGGTQGFISVPTITNATSFVINSTSATETSTVNWWIIN